MSLPWVRGVLGNLMGCLNDVQPGCLGQVVELPDGQSVVEIQVKGRFARQRVKAEQYLGWDRLHLGIGESKVLDDRIDEGALGELVGSILGAFDVDSDIVGGVALVLDV
jgi:hypothetical protein